jgi:Flp pilus assembly protein TadG
LLTLGVIDLSLLLYQAVRMQHAARDAARCVAIGANCSAGCGNTVIATVDPYKLPTGIGRVSFKLETKACYPLQPT